MPPGPYLAWTPDSRWLVCTTPGRKGWFLSLVAVDSEEKHILTKPSSTDWGDTAPAISSDGRMLAFSRYEGGYDLYVLRLSAQYAPQGEPLKLRSEHPPNLGAAWLPDGRGILFASGWRGENGLWRTSAASGATPQRLPFAPTFAADPALSRRGNRLAYTAYRSDTNIWGIELAGPSRRPAAPAPIISSTKHGRMRRRFHRMARRSPLSPNALALRKCGCVIATGRTRSNSVRSEARGSMAHNGHPMGTVLR